jgi:hypothetical protein
MMLQIGKGLDHQEVNPSEKIIIENSCGKESPPCQQDVVPPGLVVKFFQSHRDDISL